MTKDDARDGMLETEQSVAVGALSAGGNTGEKEGVIRKIINGFKADFPEDFQLAEGRAHVIAIAWPAMLESFLLNLASMVNMLMVGSLGTWAIASVGYCTQPRMLVASVFQAFNTGATALVARAKGAKDPEEANAIMHQSLMFAICASVILAVLGYRYANAMVVFMGASEEQTIAASTQYMRVVMITFPANAISLCITALLRGIGKTRASMLYNVIANAVNISVGFVFISGRFGMPAQGVRGAALGLGTGQIVAACIAVITVIRSADMLKLSVKSLFKPNMLVLKRITNIGTPAMFEQLCMRGGNIMFTKIVATLGTTAFATHQIAMNVHQLTFMNGQAFGVSATSLLGQSLGRKRPDQGKAEVQLCRRYSLALSLTIATCFVFLGRQIVGLYTTDAEVIAIGARLLLIVALLQPFQSSQQVLAGALRGAGDTKAVAICAFVGVVAIRPILGYLLTIQYGFELYGVWITLVVDQMTRSTYTMWRFISDKWKTLKV